jgi:hypothetical protein
LRTRQYMIDFCLFPVSQVRALQYPSPSHAPPGVLALRIAWMSIPEGPSFGAPAAR